MLTYFWLRAKGLFPAEVISDFEAFYGERSIPRLDPDWPHGGGYRGSLQLPADCGGFLLRDVELAPGCAVFVQRYARYVLPTAPQALILTGCRRVVHKESQGHDWALTWTTMREGRNPRGGNFYLCKYGVRVCQAENSSLAWQPAQWHSSSLASFEPTFDIPQLPDSEYDQQGVAFVTSPRLKGRYSDWKKMEGCSGPERVALAVAELAQAAADGDLGDSDNDTDDEM